MAEKNDDKEGVLLEHEIEDLSSAVQDETGEQKVESYNAANDDDVWVYRSRWLVFFVLASAATLVGIHAFRFASSNETKNFKGDVSINQSPSCC